MNAIQVLMDRFWIRKDVDRDAYYLARREIRDVEKFAREYPGWRLLANERVIKLEKTPVHARPYMGITDFKDTLDYALFCGLLIYLEDKEDNESFLLSEFVDQLVIYMKPYSKLDWTMFGHRKSLIRVMQFAEKTGLLISHEGDVDAVSDDIHNEVLYENTGLSRYFAVNFSMDVAEKCSYRDFEENETETVADTDRGHFRINRVYRRLLTEPMVHWEGGESDGDSYYLKNQRRAIETHLHEALGGRLDIHKNAAFYVQEEEDEHIGDIFPDKKTLSDVILLFCDALREKEYVHREDDTVIISESECESILLKLKKTYGEAWSKEFREMEDDRFVQMVLDTMSEWLFIGRAGVPDGGEEKSPNVDAEIQESVQKDKSGDVILYPIVFKLSGHYPKDFDPLEFMEQEGNKKLKKERPGKGRQKGKAEDFVADNQQQLLWE